MSEAGKRFVDWSIGSIVGNVVWGAVAALGLFYFNESTGCVYIVFDSMRGHELELAGWTIAFALFGALVGLMVRHRIAIRQLDDKDSAAKERISSELADIEGFKQVDSLDTLVEKARGLSSLNDQLAAEIAARDAEIAGLEKRPTREDVDELKGQLRAKDAEIAALRSAKVPTPLDLLKTRLGEDGISAFRALCAASTYVDGVPARPLVFDLDDGKLKAIGLTAGKLRHMADVGAIRLAEADERKLIGTNACQKLVDLGEGVSGGSDKVEFRLAGNEAIEVKPVHLNYGTDFLIVENNLSGADFGIASFTKEGAVLAAECGAPKPPFGMDAYLEESYSVERRTSRHHFCCLSEDGKLVAP